MVLTSFYPRWGGTETQARRQAVELIRRGHTVTVVTWRLDPAWQREEIIEGIRVLRADRRTARGLEGIASAFAMLRVMAAGVRDADVVMIHQLTAIGYLAGWLAMFCRVPTVAKAASVAVSSPSDLWRLSRPGIAGKFTRFAAFPLRHAGIAVAISDMAVRDLEAAGFRRRVRINNGVAVVPLDDKAALRERVDAEYGLVPETRLVVAAGRLRFQKGFDVLLAAWPGVVTEVPDAVLVILGSGPEEPALQSLVDKLLVRSSVHIAPPPPRVADYLRAADLVVIPSRVEGMSNVLLEAMACEATVVSTAVSGSVDLIRDGVNGVLVPVEAPPALAQKIVMTLHTSGEMGRRARQTIERHCELGLIVRLYEQTFIHAHSLPAGTTGPDRLLEYARLTGSGADRAT